MTDTNFTPDLKKFALVGLPIGQDRSPVPRSELIFTVSSGAILIATGGNDQEVNITVVLDTGFSYSIQECYASIKSVDAADWQDNGFVIVNTGALLGTTVRIELESELSTAFVDGANVNRGYQWRNFPGNLLMPSDTGASATFKLGNQVIDGAAATLQFMCRVLQYDIEQAHHYQVNTPTLIR